MSLFQKKRRFRLGYAEGVHDFRRHVTWIPKQADETFLAGYRAGHTDAIRGINSFIDAWNAYQIPDEKSK